MSSSVQTEPFGLTFRVPLPPSAVPTAFEFDTSVPLETIPWCEGQARFGFWGVLESLPVTWVNPPSSELQAEQEPSQVSTVVLTWETAS